MIGFGTVINVLGIVLSGIVGMVAGRFLPKRFQESILSACGIAILFVGLSGALSKMLSVTDGSLEVTGSVMMIICLALGTLLGEVLDIESRMESLGSWLKNKTGNREDAQFITGFVNASLATSIGVMAIMGPLNEVLYGDMSVLIVKTMLDGLMILLLTISNGKGCLFAAIPVGVVQGVVTIFSQAIQPFVTVAALSNLTLVGSVLIFVLGVNMVWDKHIPVSNMFPAVILAVGWSLLPF